jgi:DNA-binding transcriptional MocR family regulator
MAIWTPEIEERQRPLYMALANALKADIASGRLHPGDRLPTQRELASNLGISIGTVTRAYREAEERGGIESAPGRGTFVRRVRGERAVMGAGISYDSNLIDLTLAHPQYSEDPDLAEAFRNLLRRGDLQRLLRYQSIEGNPGYLAAGEKWLGAHGISTERDRIAVTAGAQHALYVLLSILTESGDLVLADELTYPGFVSAVTQLGLRTRGVPGDEEGMLPGALSAFCKNEGPKALYLIPTIHNPTGVVMSAARRKEIASVAAQYDLPVIEDDILRLLEPDPPPPISTFYPQGVFFIADMSKSVAGGVRIAYLSVPQPFKEAVVSAVSNTVFMVSPICAELAANWIEDGSALRAAARKRAEAEARQVIANEILGRFSHRTHPRSYYFWLELPEEWTSAEFAAEARRRGVGVATARPFVTGGCSPPPAVRISLSAAESRTSLETALGILSNLLDNPTKGSPGLV